MWDWDGHMGGGWWIAMMLFWLVVLVVVVWAITQATDRRRDRDEEWRRDRDDEWPRRRDTPREELDRRLARGEIDTEAYDELRARLEDGRREPVG
jgi:putative membrane protein